MKKEFNLKEETKLEEIRHKNRMKEIKFEMDCRLKVEDTRFDHELQLQRIKSAEIQKTIQRKQDKQFMGRY